jgi:hypothetical protein
LKSQKCPKYQLLKVSKFPFINPIFLSPSADSAIVAYGYDGWKGERLGEGVRNQQLTPSPRPSPSREREFMDGYELKLRNALSAQSI